MRSSPVPPGAAPFIFPPPLPPWCIPPARSRMPPGTHRELSPQLRNIRTNPTAVVLAASMAVTSHTDTLETPQLEVTSSHLTSLPLQSQATPHASIPVRANAGRQSRQNPRAAYHRVLLATKKPVLREFLHQRVLSSNPEKPVPREFLLILELVSQGNLCASKFRNQYGRARISRICPFLQSRMCPQCMAPAQGMTTSMIMRTLNQPSCTKIPVMLCSHNHTRRR